MKSDRPQWMTKEWLEAQKAKLQATRERLRSEIDHETGELGETGTPDTQEPGDVAQEDRQDLEATGSIDVSQTRFTDVEDSLSRIQAGTYGKCADCGRWIQRERLEANASAIRCLPCQDSREKRERPTPAGA